MSQPNDIILNNSHYNVVPGTYERRNRRAGGRAAGWDRVTINEFHGQRQAFAGDGSELAYGWDSAGVGPAFDGQGVEPFPNVASYADSLSDLPDVSSRVASVITADACYIGLGRRIYKSAALSSGTWAGFATVADLGAGFNITDLAIDANGDILTMVNTGQDIRRMNTATNTLTIWRGGESGTVGVGYAGQVMYSNVSRELRLSGTKWNGNAITHTRWLDAPITRMALFNGMVAIATKASLYLMGGQNYPGEADDPAVTGDTSRAPLWTTDPVPLMTHGRYAAGDDFTFLASYRGRLYTWLAGRVAEYDGDRAWARMGPGGVRCYGGCVAGDWLVVAIAGRDGGAELWGFDGRGWWLLTQRSSPAMLWPVALAGAGGRDVAIYRPGTATYDLARLVWRSSAAQTYPAAGAWRSPLLDAGAPGSIKRWTAVGAAFAAPESRGNAASGDTVTIAVEYSTDGGQTWTTAASGSATDAARRTFDLSAELPAAISARYIQIRVTWSSVSDWAPVLASVWAEHEPLEVAPPRRRIWELTVDASDRTVRRDSQADAQSGSARITALWDAWQSGEELSFSDIDAGPWSPAELAGRVLWLKADAVSGLVDGERLARWADAMGNGEEAVQTVSGAQPTYITRAMGSLPVVRFEGNDWLTVASTLGITAQPFSHFCVWSPSGLGQALMLWANNTGLLVTDFDNDIGIFSGSALFNFDQHPFGQPHIVAGIHNGLAGSLTVDGGMPVTGNTGSGFPAGNLTIGAGIAGADRWLNGDLAELIITSTAPDAATRQRIEGYLAHKWGLSSRLPGNHPYKAEAPRRETRVVIEAITEQAPRPADRGRWGEAAVHLQLDEV